MLVKNATSRERESLSLSLKACQGFVNTLARSSVRCVVFPEVQKS
jgi:hypothetical protein